MSEIVFLFFYSIQYAFLRMRHYLQSPGILSPLHCLSILTRVVLLRHPLRRSLSRGPIRQKVSEVHLFIITETSLLSLFEQFISNL